MGERAAGTAQSPAPQSEVPEGASGGRARRAAIIVAIISVAIVLQVAWVAFLGMLLVTSLRAVGF
jgi:hypothetical protein